MSVFNQSTIYNNLVGMFVCVSVFYHPIYSGRQGCCGRTSRGHTGFLHLPSAVLFIALIFLARRIEAIISVFDLEVEFWNFVY